MKHTIFTIRRTTRYRNLIRALGSKAPKTAARAKERFEAYITPYIEAEIATWPSFLTPPSKS